MSNIGYVKRTGEHQYEGELSGLLNWRGKIRLQPLTNAVSPNAPEMEVVAENGAPIGTARVRMSRKSGNPYVNLAIKHPQIARSGPIFANLGPANDQDGQDVFAIIAN